MFHNMEHELRAIEAFLAYLDGNTKFDKQGLDSAVDTFVTIRNMSLRLAKLKGQLAEAIINNSAGRTQLDTHTNSVVFVRGQTESISWRGIAADFKIAAPDAYQLSKLDNTKHVSPKISLRVVTK